MKHTFLFLGAALIASCYSKESAKSGKEGKLMPEFTLMQMDSMTSIHSSNIPSGKPIVLFYFSPNCTFCKKQTKEIIQDINNLQNIEFYLISNDPLSEVKLFSREFQLSKFQNIKIGIDTAFTVADYFEIPGVPYLAVYDKNKVLNKTFAGRTYINKIKKSAEE